MRLTDNFFLKKLQPPYWALGWHQCRYGYNTLQDVKTVVAMYAQNQIPLDTMCEYLIDSAAGKHC